MPLKDIDISRLDSEEAIRILNDADGRTDLVQRLDSISAHFLGRPYIEGSLGGGPTLPEELRIDLNAFDCVTFIETVLALALSGTQGEFIETIRLIRYQDGEVDWFHRNHYMVDWARNNESRGFIENITSGPLTVEKTCTLSLIVGLPPKATTFRYFAIGDLAQVAMMSKTGDLILFVSTRETLDVFHTGLVVYRDGRLFLRNATRTAGAVIDQELGEFIGHNKMAGFILLRPICRR